MAGHISTQNYYWHVVFFDATSAANKKPIIANEMHQLNMSLFLFQIYVTLSAKVFYGVAIAINILLYYISRLYNFGLVF